MAIDVLFADDVHQSAQPLRFSGKFRKHLTYLRHPINHRLPAKTSSASLAVFQKFNKKKHTAICILRQERDEYFFDVQDKFLFDHKDQYKYPSFSRKPSKGIMDACDVSIT
ncbi:hypothetical protein [Pseudomonas donghuensis]|uniref:hypothetical protein n=1 Tax=Pseudomonas donghuensis TaxID=1163398 RepID=UPI00215F6BA9|nr:hypothetical protein [Pseudomonas donghuensis]UVL30576.1 hypothetical protein LOY32_05565 [Pseudomonas donghuensis]